MTKHGIYFTTKGWRIFYISCISFVIIPILVNMFTDKMGDIVMMTIGFWLMLFVGICIGKGLPNKLNNFVEINMNDKTPKESNT